MAKSSNQILVRVLPISALLLVVLFKFQNCAPAPEMAQNMSVDNVDGQVRIVDRWAEQKVSFLSPNLVVPSAEPQVELQGLCVGSAKGQLISYQVIEIKDNPEIVGSGEVECILGGFQLPLAQIHFDSCNSKLQVRAIREGDDSGFAETILLPDCSG